MPAYYGGSCIALWIQTAATTILTPDFRSLKYDPAVEMVDASAGADTFKVFFPGIASGKVSAQFVQQAGSITFATAMYEGAVGTVVINPEGTATGKQKISIPCVSDGVSWTIPYNGVVELAVSWTQSSARTDGTN